MVTGNIFDSKSFVDNLKGQDAVLSGLGAPGIHIFQISLYIDSMKAITAAMNEANVKRLICITAFYTKRNLFKQNQILREQLLLMKYLFYRGNVRK